MAYTDDLHSLSHTKWNCKYHIRYLHKHFIRTSDDMYSIKENIATINK